MPKNCNPTIDLSKMVKKDNKEFNSKVVKKTNL